MNPIASYPSIYALGHRAISAIFDSPVLIEEKVDGSQFSFGRVNGELVCRSKGKHILPFAPEKMFLKAVAAAEGLALQEGWVYRAEYLQSPAHNTLKYARVPKNHLILFDVQIAPETYLDYAAKAAEATRIGLEVVPLIFEGKVNSLDQFHSFLDRESILGGVKVEGVVVKNYALFTPDKKAAIGKYVSEAFKEQHRSEWKKSNPTQADLVQALIVELRSEARWRKAIQHLKESGALTESPKDIGALIREIPEDVLRDSEAEIRDRLFAHFWPQIRRGITAGFPEFYKQQLAATVLN